MIKKKYSNIFKRDISSIGFGGWGIGGTSDGCLAYGKVLDNLSLDAVSAAYQNGINFFDTSNIYGMGKSEELIGTALAKVREDVIISTKIGRLSNGKQCFSISSLEKSFFESMKRLKSDYIDLIQLHDPDSTLSDNKEVIEFLLKLKEKGFVRSIGGSLKSPEDAKKFLASKEWDIIQINFNLIDQRALELGIFEEANNAGKEILVRTPLAFGFLAKQFSFDELNFPEDDHRSLWSKEQLRIWAAAPEKFEEVCTGLGVSIAELALKYSISQSPTITCLVGMLTKEEVIQNVHEMSKVTKISISTLNKIRKIYLDNQFFIKSK